MTNETLGEIVEMLSNITNTSVESSIEQSMENLDQIANTLANVATFVNQSDEEIDVMVATISSSVKNVAM